MDADLQEAIDFHRTTVDPEDGSDCCDVGGASGGCATRGAYSATYVLFAFGDGGSTSARHSEPGRSGQSVHNAALHAPQPDGKRGSHSADGGEIGETKQEWVN